MKAFLYGAGAALLFESREMLAPLPAGLMLGAMHVGIQLVLAPAWAESVMFALVVAVLLWRGTSREVGSVR
jgi:branched-subunit amino acid ABC-type transport system permease component